MKIHRWWGIEQLQFDNKSNKITLILIEFINLSYIFMMNGIFCYKHNIFF